MVILFGLLAAAGWVIAVAGLASVDDDCRNCDEELRPHWWAVALQAFAYVLLALSYFTGTLQKTTLAVLVFLALAAVNTEDSAEYGLEHRDDLRFEEKAIDSVVAGFIVCTFCDFVFILLLGTGDIVQNALSRVSG